MGTAAAVFLLMLVSHGGDSLSLTKLRQFQSRSACESAIVAIETAIGKDGATGFTCIAETSLEALNRNGG
jgi:hypothetical protein